LIDAFHGRRPWGLTKEQGRGKGRGSVAAGRRKGGRGAMGVARCGLLVSKNSRGRKEREEREKENREGEKKKRKEKMKKLPNMEIFGKKNKR
jgi:hypothetical protein